MKIISKYKDYYDSARAYGTEEDDKIYNRQLLTLSITGLNWKWDKELFKYLSIGLNWVRRKYYKDLDNYNPALLCFCGKVYPVLIETTHLDHPDDWRYLSPDNLLKKNKIIETANGSYDDWAKASRNKEREEFWDNVENGHLTHKRLMKFVEEVEGKPINHDIFHDLKVPYFLICYDMESNLRSFNQTQIRILKSPELSRLNFFTYFDSFKAYQEIDMFLNILADTEDNTPNYVGGDKVIIAQKGFDEMSFRTQAPGNKKIQRKENRLRKKGNAQN